MLFSKFNTDLTQQNADTLLNSSAGSSCWIIGAGPSLLKLSPEEIKLIQDSPAAKFAVNHAGRRKDGSWIVKPTHWTAYDTISKFSRALFNDPGITKFVHAPRANQTIPGEEGKLCDCPNTYFFEKECRTYETFLNPQSEKILEAQDSFIQALDIAYRLGFRHVYLLGTEMRIWLSDAQQAFAESLGIEFREDLTKVTDGRLSDRLTLITEEIARKMGRVKVREAYRKLEELDREAQYSFGETKDFESVVRGDSHYLERVEYVRLARKCLALCGFNLTSCTPRSRLNGVLPEMSVTQAATEIAKRHGTYTESLIGRYTNRHIPDRYLHHDIPMYFRPEPAPKVLSKKSTIPDAPGRLAELKTMLQKELTVD